MLHRCSELYRKFINYDTPSFPCTRVAIVLSIHVYFNNALVMYHNSHSNDVFSKYLHILVIFPPIHYSSPPRAPAVGILFRVFTTNSLMAYFLWIWNILSSRFISIPSRNSNWRFRVLSSKPPIACERRVSRKKRLYYSYHIEEVARISLIAWSIHTTRYLLLYLVDVYAK